MGSVGYPAPVKMPEWASVEHAATRHRAIVEAQRIEQEAKEKPKVKKSTVKKSHIVNNDGIRVQVDPGFKGAINEQLATVWLMKQGYDVFRNQSPVGRADLIAVKWDDGEWLAVDVKSFGYNPNGDGIVGESQKKQADKYRGSDIKYLVVDDYGSCRWYKHVVANNDNREMWSDPLTAQRFTHPRYDMTRNSWSFFCGWLLKYHRDKLSVGQAEIAKVTWQSTQGRGRVLTARERTKLMAIHRDVYQKITGNELGVEKEPCIEDEDTTLNECIHGVAP